MFKANAKIKRKPDYPYINTARGDGIIKYALPGDYAKPRYFIIWQNGESFTLNYDHLNMFYCIDAPFNRIWNTLNA
jgi:hypothetical protein